MKIKYLQQPLNIKDIEPAMDELFRLCNVELNDLSVFIDPNTSTPIYPFGGDVIIIKSDPNFNYYQQIMYQFSHELIHHLLFSITNNKEKIKDRKWEEVFAVSFALHMVNKMGWDKYLIDEFKSLASGNNLYSKYWKEIQETYPKIKSDTIGILVKVLKIEYGVKFLFDHL